MESSRWQRVKELFHDARLRDEPHRGEYLRDRCANDLELRTEVESLLVAHCVADSALEPPAPKSAAAKSEEATADGRIGRKIGAYTLRRVLGHGGMGTVYEAEQDDPRRRVALKIVRGGDFIDRHVVRLFRREMQVLAHLNHSNIAALFEAGRVDENQHYFAMELVEGSSLVEYAVRHRLTIDARIELFTRVCDGIAYAHRRGVIHRDIKPSNILVDAAGDPKILDFGLAKITESDLAQTLTTVSGRIQGTPAYMSPEQTRGNSDEIDLRSDIYSLGVVLYELLTDQLPYDIRFAPLPHATRLICEEPPTKLSAVRRSLRGDLETIVLKALEKEPSRRYQSTDALRQDLEWYRAGLPILARPPSAAYQLERLVRRHKLASTAIFGVMILIATFAVALAALYGRSKVLLKRTQSAEQSALQKAEASHQFSVYLLDLIERSSPRSADDMGNETWSYVLQGRPLPPALYELVEARRRVLLAKLREPGDHLDLAVPLTNIANLLRGGHEFAGAEELLIPALAIMRRAPERFGYQASYPLSALSTIWNWGGRYPRAVAAAREAYDIRRRCLGPMDYETLHAQQNLAGMLLLVGGAEEAERLCRAALGPVRQAIGPKNEYVAYDTEILGIALYLQARYKEALPVLKQALDIREASFLPSDPMVGRSRLWLAAGLLRTGDRQAAETQLRRVPANSKMLCVATVTRLAIGEIVRAYREAGTPQRAAEMLGDYVSAAFDLPGDSGDKHLTDGASHQHQPPGRRAGR